MGHSRAKIDSGGAAVVPSVRDGAVGGTGLMYYRARYYHPALGRFVSADTVVPEAGNPQALNRYAYVLGNPIRLIDPSGFYGVDVVQEYLNQMYGEDWQGTGWGTKLFESLTKAKAGDVMLTLDPQRNLEVYRIVGTELGEGEELWGLESIERNLVEGFAERTDWKDFEESADLAREVILGMWRRDANNVYNPVISWGTYHAGAITPADENAVKAMMILPFFASGLFASGGILEAGAFSAAGTAIEHFGGHIWPGRYMQAGNTVITWNDPDNLSNGALILISNAVIVDYQYSVYDPITVHQFDNQWYVPYSGPTNPCR
jgi:RHS repeat-associated protein